MKDPFIILPFKLLAGAAIAVAFIVVSLLEAICCKK